ncbi:MAG: PEGA domain-containing protein [Deltaproteobacteria bacterium]|nr:MAG: PEGA domain-containing protein [Deltaproteobacteria bacterium]
MSLAFVLIAAAAASPAAGEGGWRQQILFAVNEEAARPGAPESQQASKIEHTPIAKWPRGRAVVVEARIDDPSHLFAPLVFARRAGNNRYEAFTLRERGKRRFRAFLPASILSEGSFEYFIEAQHEQGGPTRRGSPRSPFACVAFDPPPEPVACTITSGRAGDTVRIDDNEVGKTPVTVDLLPGPHTVALVSPDGRSAEQHIDVLAGRKKMSLPIELSREAGGPATLSVTTEPSNANVLVDGAVLGRTPYQGELAPGQHLVAVEMEGRLRQERKIFAREGRDSNVSFALPSVPKDPALSVESDPLGAAVILDGKEKGRTPYLAPLASGRHQLVVKMEGHREVGSEFTMPKDHDYGIRLDLPMGSGSGSRLTLTSQPGGAAVTLDGKEVGLTPWAAEMRPGNHRVAVAAKGYLKEERLVAVQPNRDVDLTFALNRSPGPARLHVETEPPEAQVTVDGNPLGTSPLNSEVTPGEHELQITLEGYKTIGQQLSLDPGQQLSLKLAMQPAQAGPVPPLLAVASDPQGAEFYIDGKRIGITPIKARSTPGRHEIKLALEGYLTRSANITLPETRDFELRLAISLRPVRGVEEKHEAPTAHDFSKAQILTAHACSKQGDYECALKSYQKAFEYEPKQILLFNIAQMRRHMGQFKEAAAAYQAFLKDVPQGQERAKDEARKHLALCEAKLKPAEPAVALATAAGKTPALQEEEDTDPPILTHQPVKKAIRGQPVRLFARIVDERSGVGTAQACWRNLYSKDFECQPMAKVGEDQYGIEVPAKAVNDGFAYYLEAYDNNENGPARSGAAELPNSVAVEEAPRPVLAAVATEAVKVIPAVSTTAPKPALPAAEHEAPPPLPRKSHLASYIAAGGAVAAVLAAGALTLHANSATNDLRQNAAAYPADQKNIIQTRIDNDRVISRVLLGVSGAFVLGTITLWSF